LVNNFQYHPKASDRWGNYMAVNSNTLAYFNPNALSEAYTYTCALNNSEYPYTSQFYKEDADYSASAWHLTQIKLPSGGEININFESDDYAFVQNRPAMQMLKVVGINNSVSSAVGSVNTTANLYTNGGATPNNYLQFELPEPLLGGIPSADEIRQKYLKDINANGKFLYFRFLVNLTNTTGVNTNVGDHFEYVSGYAELDGIADCGLVSGATYNGHQVGYVKLKTVKVDDKTSLGSALNANPIAKSALNFGKCHYNNIVWDASFSPAADVIGAVKQLAGEITGGFAKTMIQNIKGPNLSLMSKGYGQQFVIGKSWIRLYNPNGHKFGGGSRVKELTIKDNWSTQTGGQEDSKYGQSFTYETTFNGATISSGVASYEPMMGGDENPFRQPVYMGPNKWSMLTPDERFFMEEPFGETFFPSASISYSKVSVKNKIPTGVNVKTHGTGYVVHEFYTAKDYPTITSHTAIDSKQYKPKLGSLLKVMGRDYVAATQGYVIKLNDMHGKQKAQSVYAEGSATPLSKVEYFYKTKGGSYTDYGLRSLYSDASCTANELDNTCLVINKDGSITNRTIGMDFDAVADFRENETTTIMGGAQINLSMFLVGVFPGLVPTIWPDFSYEKTRFRSSVLTKVQSNYGILETTKAQDMGSIVSTSNLAYDGQTGDVLVTKTKNDFEDDIYSLKYPSHWGYDLMGPAYKNIGFTENLTATGSGDFTATTAIYNIGDELGLDVGSGLLAWVCKVSGSTISLIDKAGLPITATGLIKSKVLRSGRRNLLSSQMASLTSLVSPLTEYDQGTTLFPNPKLNVSTASKVLNTSAIQYSDQWQTFKGYDDSTPAACTCSLTPQWNAMWTFMQTLEINNLFQNSLQLPNLSPNLNSAPVHNVSGNVYSNGFTAPLYIPASMPQTAAPLQWYYQPSSVNTNIANFGVACNPTCFANPSANCGQIVATAPATFNWNNITITSLNSYSLNTNATNCSAYITVCANYSTNVTSQPIVNPGSGGGPIPQSAASTIIIPTVCFTVTPTGTCWQFINCANTPATNLKCGVDVGDRVNPFVYGIRGSWRPKISYSYLEARFQTTPPLTNNNVDIRKDGYIMNYTPFYTHASGADWTINTNNWTYTSEISKHTPNGVEVENKDALYRFSSALYGYNESLPLAVASNAQLQEVAYDGFEDYAFSNLNCNIFSKEHHFDFYKHKLNLVTTTSHTGKYSMKVDPSTNLSIAKKLMNAPPTGPQTAACSYILQSADFIQPFSPITYNGAKRYILSYWVKEKANAVSGTPVLNYLNSSVNLSLSGGSGSIIGGQIRPSLIIDGWQRFEYDFTITAGATGNINIALENSGTTNTSYFDDIRIHPYNSNIKSFVYNPVTLKYVAELDANNFATFYEYDEEGSLVRVKKETEKGIMTIQETKNHTKK
jgi:hypothetical protein